MPNDIEIPKYCPCPFFHHSKWCSQPKDVEEPDMDICSKCPSIAFFYPSESSIADEFAEEIGDAELRNKQEIIIALTNFFISKYRFMTVNDELYVYKDGIYSKDGDTIIEKVSEHILGDKLTANMVNEIVLHVKRRSYPDNEINLPDYLPLKNGLLNLEDLTFQQFNPDVFLTYKIPTKYDSNADCPKFKKMLSEIFEDDENKIKLMQEIFGYCLCPSMPAQKSFWVYGSGANGKSTIFNILIAMLGRQNVSSISLYEIEYQRFALADLNGKLANILGEPSPKKLEKSNNFKKLTGGDLISADRKNQSRIEFVNTAKMIIYANQYPAISDTSDAFWRRIIVLKFTHKFDEKMARKEAWKDIADDEDEMAGVLNWAIDGLKRLKENNWIFTTGEDNNDRREFMLNSNPEMIFIEEQCVLDAEGWTSNDELWLEYSNWCDDAGVKMMEKNVFFKFISNQPGIINEKRTIAGVRRYGKKGIRLKKDLNTLSLDFDE